VCGIQADTGFGGSDGIGVVEGRCFNATTCDADLGNWDSCECLCNPGIEL